MREIKFKGKRKDTDEWVYGFLVNTKNKSFMICNVVEGPIKLDSGEDLEITNNLFEVIPESVGQFTGLRDDDNSELYVGDIIEHKAPGRGLPYTGEIFFNEGNYQMNADPIKWSLPIHVGSVKIIGNISNNPKLMEDD